MSSPTRDADKVTPLEGGPDTAGRARMMRAMQGVVGTLRLSAARQRSLFGDVVADRAGGENPANQVGITPAGKRKK